MLAEDPAHSSADELAGGSIRALEFAFVFEFHFPSDGGKSSVDVGHARDDRLFAVARGALFGATDETFQGGDGQPLTDPGAAVNALVLASLKSDFFDDLSEIWRDIDFLSGIA